MHIVEVGPQEAHMVQVALRHMARESEENADCCRRLHNELGYHHHMNQASVFDALAQRWFTVEQALAAQQLKEQMPQLIETAVSVVCGVLEQEAKR